MHPARICTLNVYHENVHKPTFHVYLYIHSMYSSMYILCTPLCIFHIHSIYILCTPPCTFRIHSMYILYTFYVHSIVHLSFALLCTFPGKVLIDTFAYHRVCGSRDMHARGITTPCLIAPPRTLYAVAAVRAKLCGRTQQPLWSSFSDRTQTCPNPIHRLSRTRAVTTWCTTHSFQEQRFVCLL